MPDRADLRPVLYVEDNENDAILFRRALTKIHSSLPLQIITDGQAAWAFLTRQGATCRPPLPSLILLDLKLPRKSGLDILSSLKRDAELKRVPVVVLTSSRERGDIERAYKLGADYYLVKPSAFEECVELARALDAYWLAIRDGAEAPGSDPTLHRLRRLAEAPCGADA